MSHLAARPQSGDSIWIKSSYSSGEGGQCVEVAMGSAVTAVRDSKRPHAAMLWFGSRAWADLTAGLDTSS